MDTNDNDRKAKAIEFLQRLIGRVEREEIRLHRWEMSRPAVEVDPVDGFRRFEPGRFTTMTLICEHAPEPEPAEDYYDTGAHP